jgi:primase-polymerase (primpol)-like protein
VKNGRGAQANKPDTWSTYDDVKEFIGKFAGFDFVGVKITGTVSEYPGFMFHQDDPFCGIDLDDCRNPETGDVAPWAIKIIKHFNSYTELSQSGTGFHIIIKGQKPAGSGCRSGGIECYDRSRYFICTGEVIDVI